MYAIFQVGGIEDTQVALFANLDEAIHYAEDLLAALATVSEDEGVAFTVRTEDHEDFRLLASITNERVTGNFLKQKWGGRKNDDAIWCGEDEFDATDHVLLMPLDQIIELEDGSESTDELGRAHVPWDGPCEVNVVDSIKSFFGVSDLEDISEEALEYARRRIDPAAPMDAVITIEVKVRVKVAAGASLSDFIDEMEYSVRSNTNGVRVVDTEIVGTNADDSGGNTDAPTFLNGSSQADEVPVGESGNLVTLDSEVVIGTYDALNGVAGT